MFLMMEIVAFFSACTFLLFINGAQLVYTFPLYINGGDQCVETCPPLRMYVCMYVCVSTHICRHTHWNHKTDIYTNGFIAIQGSFLILPIFLKMLRSKVMA